MNRPRKGRGRKPVPKGLDGLPLHYSPGFYAGGLTRDISEIYPAPIFDKLCKAHGITDSTHITQFREFLEFAASAYFAWAEIEQGSLASHEAREHFRKLGESTRSALADIEHLGSRFRLAVTFEASEASRGDPTAHIEVDADLLTRALELVAYTAERQVGRFVGGKGGRNIDLALGIWVSNARAFWTKVLHRHFSYSAEKATEARSPAYEFCRDVLRPLAPEVTPSMLSTAMRKARAGHAQKPGKNAP